MMWNSMYGVGFAKFISIKMADLIKIPNFNRVLAISINNLKISIKKSEIANEDGSIEVISIKNRFQGNFVDNFRNPRGSKRKPSIKTLQTYNKHKLLTSKPFPHFIPKTQPKIHRIQKFSITTCSSGNLYQKLH